MKIITFGDFNETLYKGHQGLNEHPKILRRFNYKKLNYDDQSLCTIMSIHSYIISLKNVNCSFFRGNEFFFGIN